MIKLTSLFRPLFACACAAVLIALAQASAHADPLVLTLNEPLQNIPYNGTATFYGTLTNISPGTVIIGTPGFTEPLQRVPYAYEVTRLAPIDGGALIRYGLSSLNNPLIPTELAPGASTGLIRLFSVDLAPDGVFNGVFTIHYYLPDQPGVLMTTTASFKVTSTPTPEPATLLLLGSGVAGLAGLNNRRRRRRGTA